MTNAKSFRLACLLVTTLLLRPVNVFAQEQSEQQPSVATGIPAAEAREQSTEAVDLKPVSDAAATDDVASNLTLSSTTIRTQGTGLHLTSTSVPGFGPTSVLCPATHRAGCTIKVEVSALFFNVAQNTDSAIDVVINGTGSAVFPSADPATESTTTTALPGADTHTFQWMKTQIPAGSTQIVNIDFLANPGSAQVGFRTATIQLYLN